MKTIAAALFVSTALVLTGCTGDDTDVANDPASDTSSPTPGDAAPPAATAPDGVPAAPGPVRSRTLATVIDTGKGPELCLGPVAESFPPQCGGPAVEGWDWTDRRDYAQRRGETRWGSFQVTGTWDGTTFAVTDAIPAALFDPAPEAPVALPEPSVDLGPSELQGVVDELADLPGSQGAYADEEGHVLVDVTYDDGSLQDYVDEQYGDGVVVVSGALVDA